MFSDADFTEGVSFAVAQMAAIENTRAEDVKDVKRQEQLYADLTQRLSAWEQAADVWTARYFGLELTAEQWKTVRGFSASGALPPAVQGIVNEAARIAREQRFFHWELAFPEIFYDANGAPKETPGFDAVIGNPPYVRQERIQPVKPFLQAQYEVYSGTADLFLYFYERGLQFAKDAHRLGYITSGTYMNSNSAKPFREYIHDNAGMEWVANFGENQPFRGAEMVYPTIAIMRGGKGGDTFRNLFIEDALRFADLQGALESGEWVDSLSEATGLDEWKFQPVELTLLMQKLVNGRATFGETVVGQLFTGVKTGLNNAFFINKETRDLLVSQDNRSNEIIKPVVRGQDLRPWYQQQADYLIFTYRGIPIKNYPAVEKYLSDFKTDLEARATIDTHEWYELQQPQMGIYHKFVEKKILWPDIMKIPRYSWDDAEVYVDMTCFLAIPSTEAILPILNSRTLWFVLSQIGIPLRLRGGLWQYRAKMQFIERLPIPDLTTQQESDLAAHRRGNHRAGAVTLWTARGLPADAGQRVRRRADQHAGGAV